MSEYFDVEYEFVPDTLTMTENDLSHTQLFGSDYNASKNTNNGEGWPYSDRTNSVQFLDSDIDTILGSITAPQTRVNSNSLGGDFDYTSGGYFSNDANLQGISAPTGVGQELF